MNKLTIELDGLDENARGNLRLWKAPYWRLSFFGFSAFFTALALFILLQNSAPIQGKVIGSIFITFSVPLFFWYLFSNRFSTAFGIGGFNQVMSGRRTKFTYALSDGYLIESSEAGNKKFPFSQFVGVAKKQGYAAIIFKGGLVYLPSRAPTSSDTNHFADSVEQHITSHSSRDAHKVGAP